MAAQHKPTSPPLLWDVFCRVIDNFGDIGVCWRLARQLAARGHSVRLWVDEPSALAWLAPDHADLAPQLQVLPWDAASTHSAGDVVIEAFGCEIDPVFVATSVVNTWTEDGFHIKSAPIWLNLEYLSAESFALRCHGLPSPVMSGPAKGLTKWFFYPGFTPQSGGLLREDGLHERLRAVSRNQVLARYGIAPMRDNEVLVTLFCYEPAPLAVWLKAIAEGKAFDGFQNTRLLVAHGRAAQAVQKALTEQPEGIFSEENPSLSNLNQHSLLQISYLPLMPQHAFDELLAAADFNCVRGEDSLVRALLAGKPLLWHIYPQHDGAHHAKLNAWLDAMLAPTQTRQAHAAWNADSPAPMPRIDLTEWQTWSAQASAAIWAQTSLVDRLLAFVAERRKPSENPQNGQKTQ